VARAAINQSGGVRPCRLIPRNAPAQAREKLEKAKVLVIGAGGLGCEVRTAVCAPLAR
jgi:molybdopterin/thiamine biosynthesis adenylyltransferase